MGKGQLGCGLQAMKYCLFIINILFFLLGIGLVAAGSYSIATLSDVGKSFVNGFGFAIGIPVVAILLGFFMLIGAGMGCVGTAKENTGMIKTFLVFLIIFMIFELGVGIAVIFYNENQSFKDSVDDSMKKKIESCNASGGNGSTVVTDECKFMVPIQDLIGCCGYSKDKNAVAADWEGTCIGDGVDALNKAKANAKGFCNQRIIDFINSHLAIVAGVLGGLLFAEICLVIGTCCLIRGINNDNKYA